MAQPIAVLTDQYIKDTYQGILHAQGLPLSGTPSTLYDGAGNRSALSVGRAGFGASINGTLTATNINTGLATTNAVLLSGTPTAPLGAIPKQYVDTNFLNLSGGTLTGLLRALGGVTGPQFEYSVSPDSWDPRIFAVTGGTLPATKGWVKIPTSSGTNPASLLIQWGAFSCVTPYTGPFYFPGRPPSYGFSATVNFSRNFSGLPFALWTSVFNSAYGPIGFASYSPSGALLVTDNTEDFGALRGGYWFAIGLCP